MRLRKHHVAAVGGLLLLALRPSMAGAGNPGSGTGRYEVVTHHGESYQATSFAFGKSKAFIDTAGTHVSVPTVDIDFYETFRRNLRSGSSNVLAMTTGSMLRFDDIDVEKGQVRIGVGDGGSVTVPESLIDYEASVREGAMVRLPAGAGDTVVVTRSGAAGGGGGGDDGSWPSPPSYDDGSGGSEPEMAPIAIPASPDGLSRRPSRGVPMAPPLLSSGSKPMNGGTGGARLATPGAARAFGGGRADTTVDSADDGSIAAPDQSPVPFEPGPTPGSKDIPGAQQPSGQTVLLLSTSYAGMLGGLGVVVNYPPTAQIQQPVSFTGFASGLMTNSNPTQAGTFKIAGAASPPGVTGPGEFLRMTFTWTGRALTASDFRVAVTAVDPSSVAAHGFSTEVTVI